VQVGGPADFQPPIAAGRRAHRTGRRILLILAIFAVLFVGCTAAFPPSRNGVIALTKGGNKTYYIPSEAMTPSLPRNSRIIVKTAVGTPKRGDVVIFRASEGTDPSVTRLVKRIVGLPGETLTSVDGTLLVDGEPLDESYLPPGTVTDCAAYSEGCFPAGPIPENEYFMLGDNRPASKDSRFYGSIPRDSITAVALRIVWPMAEAGPIPGVDR
jgi:signal peptidase I